jgi:hypothetical protein
MREFRDEEGRPWRLALTVAAALRVRDMVTAEMDVLDQDGQPTGQKERRQFDLVDVNVIGPTLTTLRSQYATLGEVLYAILLPQVDERKLTREQFLDGLRADGLESAAKALEEELIDFFPQRLRRMVALLASSMTELAEGMMRQAEAGIVQIKDRALSGASSGSLPESSDATQESGPSASSSKLAQPDSSTSGGTPPT